MNDWVVATQIFLGFSSPNNWGRKSPILTFAYFSKGLVKNHQVAIHVFNCFAPFFTIKKNNPTFFFDRHLHLHTSGLGINHEQKRADGSHEYYGKGPHLQMFWENTESWKSQYTPATKSYIGSPYDGGEDPQVGYAPYDFVSWKNEQNNGWISRNFSDEMNF